MPNQPNLGKLTKVDLREAWKHEASNFTQWLALEENLAQLGDEIGIDMKLIQTEAEVGSFNADILAEEEITGRKIIIENQLEVTNHDHLGKIITYASGHDAKFIIWVVKDVHDKHRQAINWLNEHTDETIEFYLLKIELWQIEGSAFAPKFEIIAKPNDWTKTVRGSTETSELTDTRIKQLEFWTRFKVYGQKNQTKLRFHKPQPQHWTVTGIGSSKACISVSVNFQDGILCAELYISNSKDLYHKLLEHKDQIEAELGEKAEWMELEGKKASRIRITTAGEFEDESKWENYFEWLLTHAKKIYSVFPKYIKLAE